MSSDFGLPAVIFPRPLPAKVVQTEKAKHQPDTTHRIARMAAAVLDSAESGGDIGLSEWFGTAGSNLI